MAGSVNKVILIGHLGRDPEIRTAQSGDRIANFSMATSETWKDSAGERKSRTEWHRVVVFNTRLADVVEKYLKKGSKVYVEGALATRKWQDRDGRDRYTTEVVLKRFRGELTLLDSRNDGPPPADDPDSYGRDSGPDAAAPDSGTGATGGDLDDEIPF